MHIVVFHSVPTGRDRRFAAEPPCAMDHTSSRLVLALSILSTSKGAEAIRVRVTLRDARTFHAMVSYDAAGTEVVLDGLKTNERFATDYESRMWSTIKLHLRLTARLRPMRWRPRVSRGTHGSAATRRGVPRRARLRS